VNEDTQNPPKYFKVILLTKLRTDSQENEGENITQAGVNTCKATYY